MPKRLVMLGPRERLPLGEVEAARDLQSTAGSVSSDGWGGHEGIRSRAFCIKLSFAFITAASKSAALSRNNPALLSQLLCLESPTRLHCEQSA